MNAADACAHPPVRYLLGSEPFLRPPPGRAYRSFKAGRTRTRTAARVPDERLAPYAHRGRSAQCLSRTDTLRRGVEIAPSEILKL
jgi:hypothetical protein